MSIKFNVFPNPWHNQNVRKNIFRSSADDLRPIPKTLRFFHLAATKQSRNTGSYVVSFLKRDLSDRANLMKGITQSIVFSLLSDKTQRLWN